MSLSDFVDDWLIPLSLPIMWVIVIVAFTWLAIFGFTDASNSTAVFGFVSGGLNDTCRVRFVQNCGLTFLNCTSGKEYACLNNVVEFEVVGYDS